MQTDIYCIGKQWCTFSPQNHLQYCSTSWDGRMLRSCPSLASQLSSEQIHKVCGFHILDAHLSVSFRIWSFPRTGMLLSHSGKYWLDLPWQPDRQSNNNRGNCTRNKSQPSYLLPSISFWYKTRLLWGFFATVLKFKKQKATSSTWFRIVNHNQH